jgi:hypothetical protein
MYEIDNQRLIYNAIHIVILSLALWGLSKYLMKITNSSLLKSFIIIINVYVLTVLFLVDIEIQPNSVYFAIILSTTLSVISILSKYVYDISWISSIRLSLIYIGILSIGICIWTFYIL